jgi:peptidoglycan/LPS O-acetylase OafA/YrhL
MQRLSRLDGLRGVLAVYVMLGHAMPFVILPSWCKSPFSHGEAAVDLFFALSGMVIINSLAHFRYEFWPFMKARAWRLLPVYFAALILAVGLLGACSPVVNMPWIAASQTARETWEMLPPRPFIWHLLAHIVLLHGILPQGVLPFGYITLLGPAWSLSTEWQFYLVIALILPRIHAKQRLEFFTIFLLAAGIAYHALSPFLPGYLQFSRAFLPDAAPFFALGLASNIWLRDGSPRLLILCLFIACGLSFSLAMPAKALIPLGWGLVMLVQRYQHFPVLGAVLDSRIAQALGAISYPLYLLNEPVQRLCALVAALFVSGGAAFTIIWLPLAVIMPILAATALHVWLEKPVMRGKSLAKARETHSLALSKH